MPQIHIEHQFVVIRNPFANPATAAPLIRSDVRDRLQRIKQDGAFSSRQQLVLTVPIPVRLKLSEEQVFRRLISELDRCEFGFRFFDDFHGLLRRTSNGKGNWNPSSIGLAAASGVLAIRELQDQAR